MKRDQAESDITAVALAQGLTDFTGALERLAPRPAGSQGSARMRPIKAAGMRHGEADEDTDEGDDPWEMGDDPNDDGPDDDDDNPDDDAGGNQTEDDLDAEDNQNDHAPPSPIPAAHGFDHAPGGPLVAVDAGLIRLAETSGGLIIAIRAAVVVDDSAGVEGKSGVYLLRSGPLFLPWVNRMEVLHQVGKALGEPGLYVTLDTADPTSPRPAEMKRGSDRPDLYAHRIMVLWERLAQRVAVDLAPDNAVLLLDGALTLRSRDTPPRFLKEMVKQASNKGVSVVAVSKQSGLLVGPDTQSVKAVRFWLDDAPHRACYRLLSPMLDATPAQPSKKGKPPGPRRADRILGRCYAARFSPLGETYRVDVHASGGSSDAEVLGQFLASTVIVSGYPSLLAQAHAHGYFSTTDVLALQVQATGMFDLHPQTSLPATGAFAPYQGSYK